MAHHDLRPIIWKTAVKSLPKRELYLEMGTEFAIAGRRECNLLDVPLSALVVAG